ncbi:transposable element Tcb2 transposase [Trichonephila clavipes]|nr:transposable element Tcb2 transposase [Trichonephila clavipes]
MWNRRINQQPEHCRCIRDAGVYRRGHRSNQQLGYCRCIRDAGVYRHHGRAADFLGVKLASHQLEGGQTQAEVAQAIGVSQSVISRIWNRFLETGIAGRRQGQDRRRATTSNEDRYLVLTARRHRNMNTTLLQQHLRLATGTTVSTQTVRNRLHGVGLYARRPMVYVRLTSRHRRERREWATENVNWRKNEWSNVLSESRFSVHPDNRRIFTSRDRGSRNNPVFVHESVRFGGGGVLVYGGISIDGRTDFYINRDGPLTARRYRDEILRPIVVPYAAAIGDDFILMDDNCRPHRANLVEDFLFEEGIVRMEWPDMNPIEHAWDALGRRVVDRQPPKLSKIWKELFWKSGTEYPYS